MRQISKRTSRRVKHMKDSDYDHEIGMVDEESRRGRSPSPPSSHPGAPVASSEDPERPTTASRLVPEDQPAARTQGAAGREDSYQDAREDFTPRQSLDATTEPDTTLDSQDDPKAQSSGQTGHDTRTPEADGDGPAIEVEGALFRYPLPLSPCLLSNINH